MLQNQDPVVGQFKPLLGIDAWEHAVSLPRTPCRVEADNYQSVLLAIPESEGGVLLSYLGCNQLEGGRKAFLVSWEACEILTLLLYYIISA